MQLFPACEEYFERLDRPIHSHESNDEKPLFNKQICSLIHSTLVSTGSHKSALEVVLFAL